MWRIRAWITDVADHSRCNSFVMVVIAHGTESGKLLDVEQRAAFEINQLVEEVSAISSLNGKPKIFVIDACRGGKPVHVLSTCKACLHSSTVIVSLQSEVSVRYRAI